MDRHPLERASWIAGIVSAIVAIVVWVAPPKSTDEGQVPKKAAPAPQDAPTAVASSVSDSKPTKKRSETATSPELAPQVALADAIYGPDAKNAAYAKIIDQALAKNDYAFAKDVIGKLYGPDYRNRYYLKAIDQAIAENRLEIAEEMAPNIYGPGARNAVLSRLLDARGKATSAKTAPNSAKAAQPGSQQDAAR